MATMFDSFTKTFKNIGAQYKTTGTDISKKYSADAQSKAKEFADKSKGIAESYRGQSKSIFDKLKASIPSDSGRNSFATSTSAPVSSSTPMSQIPAKKSGILQLRSKKNMALIPILLGVGVGIYFLTKRKRRK